MKNKKLLILLPAMMLLVGGITGCNSNRGNGGSQDSDTIHVDSVTLNKTTLELEVGSSENLTATVSPTNASDTSVTWSSSDTAVATVSSLGKVTAVAEGNATITVTTVDGGKTATCAVTVTAAGSVYGSLENPLTVAQAQALAATECATSGDYTADQVYVKGYLVNSPSLKSGTSGTYLQQAYLADTDNASAPEKMLAYTVNYTGACAYQHDQIIIHGYITNYNGTIEFSTKSSDYVTLDTIVSRGNSAITVVAEDCVVTGLTETAVNATTAYFQVTPDANYVVDTVTVNGAACTAEEGTYSFLVAGDTTIIVSTKLDGVETYTATLEYTDTENTTNMVTTGNNAESVNLDASVFTVSTAKNGASTEVGLNKAGQIRLYNSKTDPGNGTSMTVSSKSVTILKIAVTLDGASPAGMDDLKVTSGETVLTGTSGVYKVNGSEFALQNVSASADSCQMYVKSVVITYMAKEAVAATGITLSSTEVTVKEGNSADAITATIAPEDSTASVVWASADDTIATVTDGVITGVKAGTTTVTAYADNNGNGSLDDGEPSADVAVTVTSAKKTAAVTAPVVGETYKLGMANTVDGKTYYSTGEKSGNYGASTTDFDAACNVVLEDAGDSKVYVKFVYADDSVKYMNIHTSSKYANIYFEDAAETKYSLSVTVSDVVYYGLAFNTDDVTVVEGGSSTVATGTDYFVGTYNTNTTFGTSAASYLSKSNQYIAQMYKLA